jgi:endo-1,4-beta-D-glucanase Y
MALFTMNDIWGMHRLKSFFTPLLLVFSNCIMAQRPIFPFPQHVKYFTGTIKPGHISQQQMDSSVQSFYSAWKERYINDDAGPGEYYIWFEKPGGTRCVSEGQGYGMIIVALMAGFDTKAQKLFDGLFKYYRSHPSSHSKTLMSWAQTKDFKDAHHSSAADGDLDIAYALLLADAQWGSAGRVNYREAAQNLLRDIMKQEINHSCFSVLLSDAVESDSKDYFDMRSSDFMPSHFRLFAKVSGDADWNKVIDSNYALFSFMQKKYSPGAGVFPDFIIHINTVPRPARPGYLESRLDGHYNYNACRIPWRIGIDFILNGDGRAKKILDKINKWIRETTLDNPDNISAGYDLNGDDLKKRNFEALSFITPFAVSAMTDPRHQPWLNKLWDYILHFDLDDFDYYDNTIKMLNLVILSGNYWQPQ